LKVKDASLRKVLVVFQFGISIMLIIGTIVIFKQLHYIQTTNPGYERSQVMSVLVPYKAMRNFTAEQRVAFKENLKHELETQSSIAGVSSANQSIADMRSTNSGSADWDGHDTTFVPTVDQLSVDVNFQK